MEEPGFNCRFPEHKIETEPRGVGLMELDRVVNGAHVLGCRWVLGEPTDMVYCGLPANSPSPYCHGHHGIAYVPQKPTLRRAPRI